MAYVTSFGTLACQQIDFIKQGWLIVDTTVLALPAPANSARYCLLPTIMLFTLFFSFLFPVGSWLVPLPEPSSSATYLRESVAMDSSGWRVA